MTIAVLLSGGTGSRLGEDTPKQYLEVGGMPMISYGIRTLSEHPDIDGIQIVAAGEWQEQLRLWINEADVNRKFRGFSVPGETRQLSILNGLRDVRTYSSEEDAVLIHDAARPFIDKDTICATISAVVDKKAVVVCAPAIDTIKIVDEFGKIKNTTKREVTYHAQTPQAFDYSLIYKVHQSLEAQGGFTDDSSMLEALGEDVFVVQGLHKNKKITFRNY